MKYTTLQVISHALLKSLNKNRNYFMSLCDKDTNHRHAQKVRFSAVWYIIIWLRLEAGHQDML